MLVVDEAQQLGARIALLDDRIADVRPVEAADEDAGILQLQPFHDVAPRQRIGSRGERDARHAGIALVQHVERQVVLAEVVPPLTHAVRFVDGEEAEQPTLVQRIELRQEARRIQPLGGRIEQHQAPAHHLALDALRFITGQRRIEKGGMDAGLLERTDLVVHQRDQRTHHDAQARAAAVTHDRRNLVAQALAATGGHQHQGIGAGTDMLDDRLLRAAERAVAEHLLEDLLRLGCGRGVVHRVR